MEEKIICSELSDESLDDISGGLKKHGSKDDHGSGSDKKDDSKGFKATSVAPPVDKPWH